MSNEKLITFAIPSYNSEAFLSIALESLIPGGEEIEVLIINDGSVDKTADVAKDYVRKYPGIFRLINQNNKGHGGAINTAIKEAKGLYFKVLDSDDWVDKHALISLLEHIRQSKDEDDLILMDYTYRFGYQEIGDTMVYTRSIKPGRHYEFDEVKSFSIKEAITLHSSTYALRVLKEANISLPEHVSYEDNLFVYIGLAHSKSLYYIHESLYQYFIGREGQSMSDAVMSRKMPQLLDATSKVFTYMDIMPLRKTQRGLYRLLRHHLRMNVFYACYGCQYKGNNDSNRMMIECFKKLKKSNPKQWRAVRRKPSVRMVSGRGRLGKGVAKILIGIAHKVFSFGA